MIEEKVIFDKSKLNENEHLMYTSLNVIYCELENLINDINLQSNEFVYLQDRMLRMQNICINGTYESSKRMIVV